MIVDLSNQQPNPVTPIYAWTDLTYLLHRAGVSWRYYVVSGTEPDCRNPAEIACAPVKQPVTIVGVAPESLGSILRRVGCPFTIQHTTKNASRQPHDDIVTVSMRTPNAS